MVQGSHDHKKKQKKNKKQKTTHKKVTPQAPVAKKLPTLSNVVPTSTTILSDTRTAGYYQLIEEQQKVTTRMQEKIHALEAEVYKLEGRMKVTQTVNNHLQNMVDDTQEQYSWRSCLDKTWTRGRC